MTVSPLDRVSTSLPLAQTESTRGTPLRDEIDRQYASIPVCICSFVSGLCDSVAFNASTVFVSMQTGNTIFLALGTASLPLSVPTMWLRALCSIAAFIIGVFCFSLFRHVRPTSKATLAINFFVQSLFIFAAAALAESGYASAAKDLQHAESLEHQGTIEFEVLVPIVLLAFQFGGQIVSSRQLGYNEVPTNVLTSLYCDLFSDPNIFAPWSENPKRNRRAFAAILMFAGGVVGSWLGRSNAGLSAALWLGGAVKLTISLAWLGWKSK